MEASLSQSINPLTSFSIKIIARDSYFQTLNLFLTRDFSNQNPKYSKFHKQQWGLNNLVMFKALLMNSILNNSCPTKIWLINTKKSQRTLTSKRCLLIKLRRKMETKNLKTLLNIKISRNLKIKSGLLMTLKLANH